MCWQKMRKSWSHLAVRLGAKNGGICNVSPSSLVLVSCRQDEYGRRTYRGITAPIHSGELNASESILAYQGTLTFSPLLRILHLEVSLRNSDFGFSPYELMMSLVTFLIFVTSLTSPFWDRWGVTLLLYFGSLRSIQRLSIAQANGQGCRFSDLSCFMSKAMILYPWHCTTAGGWLHHPRGGEAMPITLTIHILGYTVTIRVKKQNRHSAK